MFIEIRQTTLYSTEVLLLLQHSTVLVQHRPTKSDARQTKTRCHVASGRPPAAPPRADSVPDAGSHLGLIATNYCSLVLATSPDFVRASERLREDAWSERSAADLDVRDRPRWPPSGLVMINVRCPEPAVHAARTNDHPSEPSLAADAPRVTQGQGAPRVTCAHMPALCCSQVA